MNKPILTTSFIIQIHLNLYKKVLKIISILYYMDNTNSQKIYKTTLSQRNAAYRYAFLIGKSVMNYLIIIIKIMTIIEKLKLKK